MELNGLALDKKEQYRMLIDLSTGKPVLFQVDDNLSVGGCPIVLENWTLGKKWLRISFRLAG